MPCCHLLSSDLHCIPHWSHPLAHYCCSRVWTELCYFCERRSLFFAAHHHYTTTFIHTLNLTGSKTYFYGLACLHHLYVAYTDIIRSQSMNLLYSIGHISIHIVLAPPPHNRAFVRLRIRKKSLDHLFDPDLAARHVEQPASPLNHVCGQSMFCTVRCSVPPAILRP